jgi:hypothetical protein
MAVWEEAYSARVVVGRQGGLLEGKQSARFDVLRFDRVLILMTHECWKLVRKLVIKADLWCEFNVDTFGFMRR